MEGSGCSGQAQEARLIRQGQVEGLTGRRSLGAQHPSQACTEQHMGAVIPVKQQHGDTSALHFAPQPVLCQPLVLPTAQGSPAFAQKLSRNITAFCFY